MTTEVPVNELVYSNALPEMASPAVVGEYFVTSDNKVLFDRSSRRYLAEGILSDDGKCFIDLNKGYDKLAEREKKQHDQLDVLFRWIMKHSGAGISLKKICHEADFVAKYNTLMRIALTPYTPEIGWIVSAVRLKDVLFLCEFYTTKKEELEEKQKFYWRDKFWQCVSVNEMGEKPSIDELAPEKEEFGIIVRGRIGTGDSAVRYLFAGEAGCVDPETDKYVEIKTQFESLNGKNWTGKSRKWWLQSVLAGIHEILVGLRDKDGIVKQMKRIQAVNITHTSTHWSGGVMLHFLQTTLQAIRKTVDTVPDLQYMLIEYVPGETTLHFRKSTDSSRFGFLKSEFLSRFASA